MIRNLKTIDQWHNTTTEIQASALQRVFMTATGTGSPIYYFFQNIYIPVRKRDSETHAMIEPAEYDYVNVGLTTEQLADAYWALYGQNMWSGELRSYDDSLKMLDIGVMSKKVKAVFELNKAKYLKWIDVMGYEYNPLYNVDGIEIEQTLDNHGGVKRDEKPILATSQLLQTNSYDGVLKDTQKNTTTYNATDGTVVGMVATSEEKHENAKNIANGAEVDYNVAATDTVFGEALTGGDFMHINKRLRQGNIGVTMTTQLLEAERDFVRTNLIKEFFNDINEQFLVGVYPNY